MTEVHLRKNGMATAGLVLGIIACAIVLIPILGLLTLPLAFVGAPLSGVGYARGRQPEYEGQRSAFAGMILNGVAIVVWFLVLFGYAALGAAS